MSESNETSRLKYLYVVLPIAFYLILRVPLITHQRGGMDEQFFSVPGLTVSQEGIPRIPYAPTRNRDTFFENSDICLMALPPGLFYIQAPFFWFLPANYPTARLPLLLAGIAAIVIGSIFVRRLGGGWKAVCLTATLLAMSRAIMFTGIMARPDLLCIVAGWVMILILWDAKQTPNWKRFAAAGVACGVGGLFHPFALVFCIQAGVWSLTIPGTIPQRIKRASVLTIFTLLTMLLWLPLILKFPHEFKSQFFANVLDRSGPGLFSRLLMPLTYLKYHAELIWEFFGAPQAFIFLCGGLLGTRALFIAKNSHRWEISTLAWSSLYLTAAIAGEHPTKGYWAYATLLFAVLIAFSFEQRNRITESAQQDQSSRSTMRISKFIASLVLIIMFMISGSGARSAYLYLTNWGSPEYHAGNFINKVLEDFPEEGLFVADSAYVFDIYASGRETLLCENYERYWGDRDIDYDYIMIAFEGVQDNRPPEYNAAFLKKYGRDEKPQSCFVEVYVPEDAVDE